jgi:hypothetical protein
MSPLPEGGSITVPVWVIVSVIVPVSIGILAILRWLGLREIERWERERQELREEIQDLKRELAGKEDKIDRVLEKMEA